MNVVYPCNVPKNNNLIQLFFKSLAFGLFYGLFSFGVFGQYTYTDLLEEKDNTQKAEIGLHLLNEYRRNDFDSLKYLAVHLLLNGAGKNEEFTQAVGFRTIGAYYIKKGKIKEGIANLNRAKDYFEEKGDLVLLSETMIEIGNAYFLEGNYKESIKRLVESMKIGKKSSDKTLAFAAKITLGQAYCALGDTAVGVFSILQYKDLALEHKRYESVANAYATLGMIEFDRNNLDLSKEYYEQSLEYSGKSDSKVILSHAYNNKAILHFNLGEMDSSLMYFEMGLRLREKLNQTKGIVESYFNIASFYQATGDYDNALYYFNQSVELAKKNKFNVDEVDALSEMISIYTKLNNPKEIERIEKRIAHLKQFISERESIDDEILEYAEEVMFGQHREKQKKDFEEKGNSYIWLLVAGIIVLLIFGILRRPN